jgi:hypothetical protein
MRGGAENEEFLLIKELAAAILLRAIQDPPSRSDMQADGCRGLSDRAPTSKEWIFGEAQGSFATWCNRSKPETGLIEASSPEGRPGRASQRMTVVRCGSAVQPLAR